MFLYILKPIEAWEPWYDKVFGLVVRANDVQSARLLASEGCGDGGQTVWLDNTKTSCELLSSNGPSGVVLRDCASA